MRFMFVFPGQGSQSVGMMASYEGLPAIRETFVEASDVLGEDLWEMAQSGPAERLSLTVNTQPLRLTAGVAVWRAWRALGGPEPALLAGHSLGEYTALVAAESLSFADALPLVRLRAQAMQEAVPAGVGAMAAVMGLDAAAVETVCRQAAAETGETVAPANLNAPGQIVIAGHKGAVERAAALAKEAGAKRAVPLPVSAPFHCELMKPAAERLAERLAGIALRPPRIPVLHNVDVAEHRDPEEIRRALVEQAWRPVRWIETIEEAARRGITHVYECGPGKVLAALTKRIVKDLDGGALADAASLRAALEALAAQS